MIGEETLQPYLTCLHRFSHFAGSWRPIGHMRPSSPLLDSVRDQFEDYDQIAKDFTKCFLNSGKK